MSTAVNDCLTAPDVAQKLQVSRETVCNWVRTGKLPGIRYGKRYLIAARDVENFKVPDNIPSRRTPPPDPVDHLAHRLHTRFKGYPFQTENEWRAYISVLPKEIRAFFERGLSRYPEDLPLSVRDASYQFNVGYDTVLGWVRDGKVPAIRGKKNKVFVGWNDVQAFLTGKSTEQEHIAEADFY